MDMSTCRVLFRTCLPCEQSLLRSSFLFPIFPREIEGDSARRVVRVGFLSLDRNACHAEKTHEYRQASAPHVKIPGDAGKQEILQQMFRKF